MKGGKGKSLKLLDEMIDKTKPSKGMYYHWHIEELTKRMKKLMEQTAREIDNGKSSS